MRRAVLDDRRERTLPAPDGGEHAHAAVPKRQPDRKRVRSSLSGALASSAGRAAGTAAASSSRPSPVVALNGNDLLARQRQRFP